jgi:hypothetical protein
MPLLNPQSSIRNLLCPLSSALFPLLSASFRLAFLANDRSYLYAFFATDHGQLTQSPLSSATVSLVSSYSMLYAPCSMPLQIGMNFAEFGFVYRKKNASLYGEQC